MEELRLHKWMTALVFLTNTLFGVHAQSGSQSPLFTADNYTIYVSEGVPVSSSLWVIPVNDSHRDSLSYFITSSIPESDAFNLDNSTGNPVLRNARLLDRERNATYTLNMRVQDNALNNDTATVTVIVTDVNDKAPVFSPSSYNFSLQENQASGTSVGTVTATDGDAPNTQFSAITYSLQQPNPDFSINPRTGIITSNRPFDYETQKVYVFVVLASDGGMDPLVAVCQVTVNLLDLPDNVPVFDKSSYTFYVEEQMIANTTVGTVTATDLDSPPVVQYQFADSASSDFTINAVSGLIQTKIPLDYNIKSVYTFPVTTKDGSSSNIGLSTATVTVIVQDVNNFSPVISAGPAAVTILETVNLGYVIVDVNATDNDPPDTDNSRITFSIRSVTPSAGEPFFFMNGNSGLVSVAAPLTSAGSDQYTIEVRVCDQAPTSLCANVNGRVTVTVIRNHYPYFVNLPYSRDLNTTFNPGQVVVTAEGRDNDSPTIIYGQLRYALIGDDGNENAFTINSTSGVISVGTSSSSITAESFQLRIQVCDLGGLCNTTVAIVTVRTNRFAPTLELSQYLRTIQETFPLGEAIFDVNATDADVAPPNNQFSFFLLTTTSTVYLNCFTINTQTGIIYAIRSLSVAPCNETSYSFQVAARDNGRTSLTSSPSPVQISVIKNQNPPKFTENQYSITILENTTSGSSIIRISATDADIVAPFNTLSYYILGDDTAQIYFRISKVDNNNIDIILQQSVLNTNQDQYLVQLYVEDGGGLYDTTILNVTIRRNLNPPVFNPTIYNLTIFEDQQLGNSIGAVTATDPDSPKVGSGQVTYSVLPGTEGATYFAVAPLSGIISTVNDLKVGTSSLSYMFLVSVRDLGNPSLAGTNNATVTVTVKRNLKCPSLTNLPQEIPINATQTGPIFLVQSNDSDDTIRYNTPQYQLAGDGAQSTFFINRASGEITVTNALFSPDDLVYKLQVIVNDGFCFNQSTLTVRVRRNLSPPRWTGLGPSFAVDIPETKDILQSLIVLTAIDDDTRIGNIVSYRFVNTSDYQNLFYIDTATGAVYLRRTMVGVIGNTFTMSIVAVDDGGLMSSPGTLTVTVARNDFAPEFLNLPNSVTVRSDLNTAQELFRCTFRDNDTETTYGYNIVNFRIVGEGRATSIFAIDLTSCSISLRTSLSTDNAESYRVIIEGYDLATTAVKSSTGTLSVFVNRNLNIPIFRQESYTFEILETLEVGSSFGRINATDLDAIAPYNTITYLAIGNSTVLSYFGVDTNTGNLFCLRAQWQYPNRAETTFTYGVSLRDGVGLLSATNATVTVTVIRNTQPVFINVPYSVTINKTTSTGTTFFLPTVRNSDTRSPFNDLEFELIGDGSTNTFFQANFANGGISLKPGNNLEQDTGTVYVARLIVRDGGTPRLTDTATVLITVPRNNFAPQFLHGNLTITIPFNLPIGTVVADVNATDLDGTNPGSNITYTMVGGNFANNIEYFKVYPDTGELILVQNSGLGNINSFLVTLRAWDNGVPQRTGDVTVLITVIHDDSQLRCNRSPFTFTVSENVAINTSVGNVLASPGTVQYRLVGSPPGNSYFAMDTNGLITVSTRLTSDPASLKLYQLLVEVTRSSSIASSSVTCTVSITVTRNENPPIFRFPLGLSGYSTELVDNTPPGQTLLTVNASDADNDVIAYSIISSNPVTSAFYLHPATGAITLTQSLIGNNISSYILNIRASDQRRPDEKEALATVTITILRDQFDPVFTPHDYPMIVREDTTNGISVGNVTASDADLKGRLVFEVIGNGTAPAFFTLGIPSPSGNTATVNVVVQDGTYLRRDQSMNYVLNLIVYDSAYTSRRDTLQVVISMQRNLNAPQLNSSSYSVTIPDSTPAGTIIFRDISARDVDGDVLLFDILPSTRQEYYSINPFTGQVSLAQSLIGTSQSTDLLNLRVRDQRTVGERNSTATLQVIITRDAPPVFINLPAPVSLPFNAGVNFLVFTVNATDSDLKGNINYELVGNYPALSYFTVNRQNGHVRMNRSVLTDELLLQQYQLVFVAYDTFYPNNRATAMLNVTFDRNPSPPVCNPTFINQTLDVLARPGAVLATVVASDPEGNSPRYSFLLADPEDLRYFLVVQDSGQIILKESLPSPATFTFTVQASDQDRLTPKNCTTTVQFTVGTDQPPVFVPSNNYTWNISENAFQAGSVYSSVSARDNDLQGQLVFEVNGLLQAPSYFAVNTSTAHISVIRDLKEDVATKYELIIVTYDSQRPSSRVTCTVSISVIRNPNPPIINSSTITIEELTSVATNVVNISASDPDGDTLRYSMQDSSSGRSLEYFWINPDTGSVRILKPLTQDSTRPNSYQMVITVRDQRVPEKSATGTLTVNVLRDVIPPEFLNTPYMKNISETLAVGTSIFTVTARDRDLKGQLVLEKVGDGNAVYFFNLINNTVYLANDLTTDDSFIYILRFRAFDSFYPSNITEATLNISVSRNEFAPVFVPSPVNVFIEETESVGNVITIVNATDQNTKDTITYAATGNLDTLSLFSLDSSGAVRVKNSLFNLTKDLYIMTVVATDSGKIPRQGTVTVNININRYPGTPSLSPIPCTSQINETVGVGSPVNKLTASDTKTAGRLLFSVLGEYPAESVFAVNESTGLITTRLNLRTQTLGESQYKLVILGYDSARPRRSSTVTCTISVLRNSNPPVWQRLPYNATIRENQPYISSIYNVTATDNDAGDVISYRIVDEQIQRDFNAGPSQYFMIDMSTGNLLLTRSLLNTGINSFLVTVEACDNGKPQRCTNATVRIVINRTGSPPVCSSNSPRTISETSAKGQAVMNITATDADLMGSLVYELVYPYPIALVIDPATGVITLAETIKDDMETVVNGQAKIYDSLDPARTTFCNFTIYISRNLAGPLFTQNIFRENISEYHSVLQNVINITAIDSDNDVVVYSVVDANQPAIDTIFYLNSLTGAIFLRKSLEGTRITFYNITVRARDNHPVSPKEDFASVLITVNLDQTPFFTLPSYSANISDLYAVNSTVLSVSGVDSDLKGQLVYESSGIYPAESFFRVNSSTGAITLTSNLKNDPLTLQSYQLRVLLYDSAHTQRQGTAMVTIFVVRNQNGPIFQPDANYVAQINEGADIGQVVVNIRANDTDNDVVTYSISPSSDNGTSTYFFIDPSVGDISVRKPLIAAPRDVYQFNVMASDGRNQNSFATVTITILRTSDRPPQFIGVPYNAPINVYQPVNSTVVSVKCTDPDLNATQIIDRINYIVIGYQPGDHYFRVDKSGAIVLVQNLSNDAQYTQTYILVVQCYDTANPSQRAQEVVVITVNRNPNAPQFTPGTSLTVTIPDSTPINTLVMQLNATDADGNVVSFFINQDASGALASNFFFISFATGAIYVNRDLRPALKSYTFTVSAYDNGIPQQRSQITVTIFIERDGNVPSCSPNNQIISITENEVVNVTQIYTYQATDTDRKGTLRFTKSGDGLFWAYFQVSGDGRVTVQHSLRDTIISRFELIVAVYDTYYPNNYGYCNLTVLVSHNVDIPTFNSTNVILSLFEYTSPGNNFYNASAIDSDNDEVRYSISGDDEDRHFFGVDGPSGQLYLLQSLNLSPTNSYSFEVLATDRRLGVSQTGRLNVTVNVLRDTTPNFVNLPNTVTRDEDDVAGVFVYQLSASDSNRQGSLMFSAIGNDAAPSMFNVAPNGTITVKTNLSLDPTSSYNLVVKVYDSVLPNVYTTSTLTINVNRNQFDPEFTKDPYTATLDIQTQVGDRVLTINATDRDGDTPTYKIVSGDSSYFLLNPDTGVIYLVRPLSASTPTSLTLRVQATDRPVLGRKDVAEVIFTTSIVPTLPEFVNLPYTVPNQILETTPVGTVIYNSVSLRDGDLKGNLTYRASGLYPADYFFAIDPRTGAISVAANLTTDELARSTYTLNIYGFDSQFPTQTAMTTVTINVLHNPNTPQITGTYDRTVPETLGFGEVVFNITAQDADIGDTLTYTLLRDNNGRSGLSYFYVQSQTGQMYIWRSLTQAPDNQYTMTVRVSDSGRPSKYVDVTARVTIERTVTPNFTAPSANVNVEDTSSISSLVFDANAVKTSPSGTIRYRLAGSGLGLYYFIINDTTGVITVRNDLRTGRDMQYTLLIEAYDDAFPNAVAQQTLTVNMLRNQNGPIFTGTYTGRVSQDTAPGTPILNVTATDRDGDNLIYTLTGDQNCLRLFYMNPFTGVLTFVSTAASLTNSQYTCNISVSDGGYPTPKTSTTQAVINVTTEARLVFNPAPYPANINESAPVGTSVQQIIATKSPNPVGSIVYTIVGDYPAPSFFTINNSTGVVTISRDLRLDDLKLNSYTVRIEAFDSAYPTLRSSANLIVSVSRNINPPNNASAILTVPETSNPGSWSYVVNATDPDSKTLTCSIAGNAKALEYFKIDSRTCVLTMIKNLTSDPDKTNPYQILVNITDDGNPPKQQIATITVIVPRDQFKPTFSNLPNTVNISETSTPGIIVWPTTLQDNDKQGQFVCEIRGDYPATLFFAVDPINCSISVIRQPSLDPAGTGNYTVRVRGYDTAYPNNFVEGSLNINVNRNANPPIFSSKDITFTLSDNFPSGFIVYNLTAQDTDGDKLRYFSLSTNDSILRTFYVNYDGSIILLRPLKSSDNIFQFSVRVTDDRPSFPKTDDAQVTITINHTSGPPVFRNTPYNIAVPLNRDVNNIALLTVTALDPNLIGSIMYRLKPFKNAGTYFSLSQTGALTLITPLTQDTEHPTSYVMLAEAYDSAVPDEVVTEAITVSVSRNNYDPRFEMANYTATINDFDDPGTVVGAVKAIDSDPQAPENIIIYSLTNASNSNQYFNIDPYTGTVTTSRRLSSDTAKPNTYILYIRAQDSSATPRTSTVTMTVNVIRNTAPYFPNLGNSNFPVPDKADVGSIIITIKGSDNDSPTTRNGQITHRIVEDSARRLFNINSSSGEIYTVRSMQGITQAVWNFTVEVSDNGIPPLSARTSVTLTVTVTQPITFRNDNPVSVPENSSTNAFVASKPAYDPLGQTLGYAIEGDGQAPDYFAINSTTGEIFLKRSLADDSTRATTYRIRVAGFRLSDPNTKVYGYQTVIVNRNPTQPVFVRNTFTFNITESQRLGEPFGSVTAVDQDVGEAGRLTYSIVPAGSNPNSVPNYFYINPTNGDLSVKQNLVLDRPNTKYIIQVQARDNGIPALENQGPVTAIVNVARNPNVPVFGNSSYIVTISEEFPLQTNILTVHAVDADNDSVSYSIVRDNQDALFFNIDDNGVITLQRSVIDDPSSSYVFRVEATDNRLAPGISRTNVRVNVIRNPNAPAFLQSLYNVTISEYLPVLTSVLRVSAVDADAASSPSGRLTYSIKTVTNLSPTNILDTNFFIISPTTGEIILARDLKTILAPNHVMLVVVAADQSVTPKSSSATVDIFIQRNDYGPYFINEPYSYKDIYNLGLGQTLLTLSALDEDVNNALNMGTPNALFDYSFVNPDNSNARYFQIDSLGSISKRINIPNTNIELTYRFDVRVRDRSWQPKEDITTVSITVLPTGSIESVLGFTQPVYYLRVQENTLNGTKIQVLNVANQGEREIVCSILEEIPSKQIFNITYEFGYKNCYLSLRKNLDREQDDTHQLTIKVDFRQTNRKKRQVTNATYNIFNVWPNTTIFVKILDVNDNKPLWKYPPYPRQEFNKPDGTAGRYYGAISLNAKSDLPVMESDIPIFATDADLGNNGTVDYVLDPSTTGVPFRIELTTGVLYNTEEFSLNLNTPRTFEFKIIARDRGEPVLQTSSDVCVALIDEVNRLILPIDAMSRAEAVKQQEKIRQSLQNSTGFIIIIETIEGKRTIQDNNIITSTTSTDVIFVVAPANGSCVLFNVTQPEIKDKLLSADQQDKITTLLGQSLAQPVQQIRTPFPLKVTSVTMITKSYIWWMDDPWAALVALAAIIILLCIVGIVVIIFTYSRYMKFLSGGGYNIYSQNYDNPEFVEPPSFLREYETQSLNMYVPPDEAIHSYGEVGLNIEGNRLTDVQHTSHDANVVAAVNPVYQS